MKFNSDEAIVSSWRSRFVARSTILSRPIFGSADPLQGTPCLSAGIPVAAIPRKKDLAKVIHAWIPSRFNMELQKHQMVQTCSCQIIVMVNKIIPPLYFIHWLPIYFQAELKNLVLVSNCKHPRTTFSNTKICLSSFRRRESEIATSNWAFSVLTPNSGNVLPLRCSPRMMVLHTPWLSNIHIEGKLDEKQEAKFYASTTEKLSTEGSTFQHSSIFPWNIVINFGSAQL